MLRSSKLFGAQQANGTKFRFRMLFR